MKPSKPLGIVCQLAGLGLCFFSIPHGGQGTSWGMLIAGLAIAAYGGWAVRGKKAEH